MPLNAKLVVVGGDVKTAEIKLRLPSTIGRGRGTTIMLPHPLVSRQHCELFESNGQLMVRDLGSLNGTFVNNQRVTEALLPPGELLTIGTVTFRAVYEAQPEVSPPQGPAPQIKSEVKTVHRHDTAQDVAPRSAPPSPKAAATAPTQSDEGDFDFDQPLLPVDEDMAAATPIGGMHGVHRSEEKAEEPPTATPAQKKAAGGPSKPGAPTAGKSAPPTARPAAPASTPPGKSPAGPAESPTIDFSKWKTEEDEAEKIEPEADEDLNDFLKSMGKKGE
jgi:predicted component of type VI protein secretion system